MSLHIRPEYISRGGQCMARTDLRFRQIHLDFHTSEHIPDVGSQFDAEEFAETLEKARVDSITCFARCHHGWLYYDSKRFPERIHPHLVNRDLLKGQIEACHRRGIRVPIYVTVQWDYYTAREHPEWRIITAEGKLAGTPPYEAGFYQELCVNSPYRDFLKFLVQEILETLRGDGLFFDIVDARECSCRYCIAGMKEKGLDPARRDDRMKYAKMSIDEFKLDMSGFVKQFKPDATIFYNAGHIGPYVRESLPAYTHFELESLPSGGWGYVHFPLTIRYARNLGIDCVGQTGKFHTSWGDFHSFKNKAALQFECFRALALNAKCGIGDQLHPSGKISKHVYDLIGSVYSEVEKKEPWCKGARAITDIGLFTPEEFTWERVPPAAAGAVRMLQEAGHQFDILDSRSELAPYKLIILPDGILISDELAAKLEGYLASGGKLIASGESGLNMDKSAFALKALGVRLRNNWSSYWEKQGAGARFAHADYILPKGDIGKGLPPTEHVMYMKAMDVEAEKGTEVLADVVLSYFDRTWEHFCSHRQTPSSGKVASPAITRSANTIYFAHPIFTLYDMNAPRWCKMLLLNAIDMLLGEPVLRHDGPSTILATVNEQADKNRWVVHLLHYIPERRSQDIDIIEDVIPLYDVRVSVRTGRPVKTVTCVPDGEALPFEWRNYRVSFVVPKIEGHQMIELTF